MGQVLGQDRRPARQAAVGAGFRRVPADTIKVCASSIRAVEIADSMIRAGDAELVVTGGMESMSNAPYILAQARFGYRLGDGTLIDLMTHDGLTSSLDGKHMVEQASFVSRELGIAREDRDRWALRSHERAAAAQDAGRFDDEIVAVGELTADESLRRDTTYERLRAEACVDPEGTTTAGNAPGVNDGACASSSAPGVRKAAVSAARRSARLRGRRFSRTRRKAGAIALEKAGRTWRLQRVELNGHSRRSRSAPASARGGSRIVNERRRRCARPSDRRGGRILGT